MKRSHWILLDGLVPVVWLRVWALIVAAAFLEVKTDRGRLSSEQREWRDWFIRNDAGCGVVRSVDDVRNCLVKWRVPARKVVVCS